MEVLVGALLITVIGVIAGLIVVWNRTHRLAKTIHALTLPMRTLADNQVLSAKLLSLHQDTLATKVVLKEDFLRELN